MILYNLLYLILVLILVAESELQVSLLEQLVKALKLQLSVSRFLRNF